MHRPSALAGLGLFFTLFAALLPASGPPVVELEPREASIQPRDLRLLAAGGDGSYEHPDLWCPSGEEFDAWLEWRRDLPMRSRRLSTRGPGDGPELTYSNGVIIMEDDGSILRNDRPIDLPLETLEFLPTASGYSLAWIPQAYETDLGTLIIDDRRYWMGVGLDLQNFTFPIGGQDRTRIWVTTGLTLFFETPTPPQSDYLCGRGCWLDEAEILLDRTPRVAPLQHGTSAYGWNAWFREEADRAVFTWRVQEGGLDLDVQAVIYADGRVRFNYAALTGIPHGAPNVVTGNADWWADRAPAGSVSDPAGNVTIPAPDGPGMDITGLSVDQIAGSEILEVRLDLAAPLPPAPEEDIYYYIGLRDEATDTSYFRTIYFRWRDGAWNVMMQAADYSGATLRLYLSTLEMPLTDDDLVLDVSTFRGSSPFEMGDAVSLEVRFTPATDTLMTDLGDDPPLSIDRHPIYESFSLPELLVAQAYQALADTFPEWRMDGVALYQNFDTDIIYYAGGYHAGGNPGVDGIGRGSSSEPEQASILHVNNVYRWGGLDWAMTVLSHEFGHRWLTHFTMEEDGAPSNALNPLGGHPAGYVHMPAAQPVYRPNDYSCMGGSNWTDNGDGTFTSEPADTGDRHGYTWDELYLMGLAGPWEVPDWWYIRDTDPPQPGAYWPQAGVTVTGERVPVSIDQIIAHEGPRVPAFPESRLDFTVPLVLVIRDGVVNQDEIDFVRALCDNWSDVFSAATVWRGSLRCAFTPPEVTISHPGAPPPAVPPGSTIFFRGRGDDADGDAVTLSWHFDGVAPEADGPGPHPVTFPTEGTFHVTLSGLDATGMADPTPEVMTIVVQCDGTVPPDVVEDLRVAREDEELRLTWRDLLTSPSEYVLLRSVEAAGPFRPAGSAPSGSPGLLYLEESGGLVFYEVAGWYEPGCLGPY